MDIEFNRNNFIAQKFYRELQLKYHSTKKDTKITGLYEYWNVLNGRKIKLDFLNEAEFEKASKITLYLRVLAIKSNMENLLDCLIYICSNCNFD